ncbi:MAG: UbiA family prenyltransferase [Prochloraceae cyanobacterium]
MFFLRPYQRFLEIFIYPSIWVGAGIASLSLYVQMALNLPLDWHSPVLILFTSLVFYNLDRIFDVRIGEIPDNKLKSFFSQKLVFIIVLLAALASIVMLILAPDRVRLVSLGALVPLIYGMPLLKLGKKWYRLKDIPGSKAIIVAVTLTYATVALPIAYTEANFNLARAILLTIFLLVFIGTNSHLFDLRDLKEDRAAGVLTLPVVIGVKSTRILFTLLNILVLIIFAAYWFETGKIFTPITILGAIALDLIIIWWLKPTTPRNVYNISIDGCLFLPLLLINFEG